MQLRRFWSSLALTIAACGGGGNTSGIPDECNPLGGGGCLLPWPSMTYATTDSSSPTGYRVDVPIEAMPTNIDGIEVDPGPLDRWDGFSPIGEILASFPTGVSSNGLPGYADPSQSLADDSPIVLLDMDTGEHQPFFAEIDQNITVPSAQDLIIRPLARLKSGGHYVVAIRNTVTAADGSPLPVPAAFAALRDGKSFDHPRFAALVPRYADIFAALSSAGIDKSELVLAWDFVTATDDFLQGDLMTMRAAALPAMGTNGSALSFAATPTTGTTNTYVSYTGTFKSPTFLDDGEEDDSIIARDASGSPVLQGLRDARFAAIIPECVTMMPLPRPIVVFGHGLFGSSAEYISDPFTIDLANQLCVIIVAGDFIGLTDRQLQLAPLTVNDMNRAPQIAEKLGQSVIDFMALETIARGPMATSQEFSYMGQPVMDTTREYYIGGSLGGIMGNTFMAYDPNITRGVLAVAGGDWDMLFERSNAWSLLIGAAQGAYEDPAVYQTNVALLGMAMEPYDPITTAAHVISDPLPGTPVKNILLWYSLGDCLVNNLTSELISRTMGLPVLAPSVKTAWGLEDGTLPLQNAVNVFDAHPTPLPPTTNVPPAVDNGTHSGINREPAALRLAEDFGLNGVISNECMLDAAPAPCDCSTGACD